MNQGLTLLVVLVGACVHVDPAPGGVASARLDPAPPSVAIGDSLRDSLGVATRVHGVAYDASGGVVATAGFRYAYVPTTPDTTTGASVDTALVVDSTTGAVRATARWVRSSGRVFVRIGASLQLADTIQIVPRPDSVVATTPTDTVLRYSCQEDRATPVQVDTILNVRNTAGPFSLVVRGDSARMRVNVRRWLVRWSVDSVYAGSTALAVPTVTLKSGATVPAITVIKNSTSDVRLSYDTTDASGTSGVLLRIRQTALGPAFSADTTFRVTLRADVIAGAGQAVRASPVRGRYTVRLIRVRLSSNGSTTCAP